MDFGRYRKSSGVVPFDEPDEDEAASQSNDHAYDLDWILGKHVSDDVYNKDVNQTLSTIDSSESIASGPKIEYNLEEFDRIIAAAGNLFQPNVRQEVESFHDEYEITFSRQVNRDTIIANGRCLFEPSENGSECDYSHREVEESFEDEFDVDHLRHQPNWPRGHKDRDAIIAHGKCLFEPSEDGSVYDYSIREVETVNRNNYSPQVPNLWPPEHSFEVRRRKKAIRRPQRKQQEPWWKSHPVWMIIIIVLLIIGVWIFIAILIQLAASKSQATNNDIAPAPSKEPTGAPTLYPTNAPSSWPTLSPTIVAWDDDDGTVLAPQEISSISQSRDPEIRLTMGPMVGHTTHESVTLWAYYNRPSAYRQEENYNLEIRLSDSTGPVETREQAERDPQRNNAVFATFSDLKPNTVYSYEMRILDQLVGNGSFKTAPLPSFLPAQSVTTTRSRDNSRVLEPGSNGVAFEYVLTSCMDPLEHPVQKAWEAIPTTDNVRSYPDFALMVGDTMYLKEGIDIHPNRGVLFDRYWYRNFQQRTEPHFADFVRQTPTYAVWNNHDYGSDESDRFQPGKGESLRAWRGLWPNPESPGMQTNSGIYYSFYWGDVHYIVTDDHWNRDYGRENRWGNVQTNWIISELLASRGTFKVIVIGSDIMQRGWGSDLENLGAAVKEHKINGIIFNAGDIHRNEYKRVKNGAFPYPVTQISSSGIAKVWRKPFAKIAVDTTVDDPYIRVRFFGATKESNDNDVTWNNDPDLVCSMVEGEDREKEHSCTETIRLSDISSN